MTAEEAALHIAACRRALLVPPPAPPSYEPHTSLQPRQLRRLVQEESREALDLARRAGLEIPPCS